MVLRGQQQKKKQKQQQQAMEAAERTSMDPAVAASAASVALSWYYFYLRGDRNKGIFVGMWPPTILAFASYFKQTKMSDMVEKATGRSGIVNSIERAVQSRNK